MEEGKENLIMSGRERLLASARAKTELAGSLLARAREMGGFHAHIVNNLTMPLEMILGSSEEMYADEGAEEDLANDLKETEEFLELARRYMDLMEQNKAARVEIEARASEYERMSPKEAAQKILQLY